ncbi:MAG TPA: Fic family protein [Candidatus Thermoplasmatota archaeon]|nr:Fic family protein [Candidatus Thermoplasmatota archaeon]
MVHHLTFNSIKQIHDKSIEENEDDRCERPEDIYFSIDFVKDYVKRDLYKQSLGYCISLIVLHPFKEGNHRTSLYSAIIFLILNKNISDPSVESVKSIQEWRTRDIDKDNYALKREFFRITCIENNDDLRKKEILKIMNSNYGITIEKWLRKYCK